MKQIIRLTALQLTLAHHAVTRHLAGRRNLKLQRIGDLPLQRMGLGHPAGGGSRELLLAALVWRQQPSCCRRGAGEFTV
jgi:hypothetical protein